MIIKIEMDTRDPSLGYETEALEALAKALTQKKEEPKKVAKKEEVKKEEEPKKEAKKEETKKEEPKKEDLEAEIRAIFRANAKTEKREDMKALLAEYGVAKGSELTTDQQEPFLKKLKAVVA